MLTIVVMPVVAWGAGRLRRVRLPAERGRPEGFLVEVAHGSVVDDNVLVELLINGRLGGAGLDVPLPHLAGGTVETRADMVRLAIDTLESWLSHGRLVTPVPETATVTAGR